MIEGSVATAAWPLDVVGVEVEVEAVVGDAKVALKQPAPMVPAYAPAADIKLNIKLGSPAMGRSALNAKRK